MFNSPRHQIGRSRGVSDVDYWENMRITSSSNDIQAPGNQDVSEVTDSVESMKEEISTLKDILTHKDVEMNYLRKEINNLKNRKCPNCVFLTNASADPSIMAFLENLISCMTKTQTNQVQSREEPRLTASFSKANCTLSNTDEQRKSSSLQADVIPIDYEDRTSASQVELSPGSNVFITRQQKTAALLRAGKDRKRLVRELLKVLVGEEKLANCSAKGQRKSEKVPEYVINAVKDFVMNYKPSMYKDMPMLTDRAFNHIVNAMCGTVRRKFKKLKEQEGLARSQSNEDPRHDNSFSTLVSYSRFKNSLNAAMRYSKRRKEVSMATLNNKSVTVSGSTSGNRAPHSSTVINVDGVCTSATSIPSAPLMKSNTFQGFILPESRVNVDNIKMENENTLDAQMDANSENREIFEIDFDYSGNEDYP